MLIPVKWLSEYVNISDIDVKTLEDRLIMSGSNTETVHETLKNVENIVVGKILKIEQHPDADKLKVLAVDLGDEVVQIVTGATNVLENVYLPVCKVNSVLADGTKIKKGKLRGVESYGMLCSYQELGFETSVIPKAFVDGVWLLDQAYPLGTPIGEIENLKDHVIEFEITPNRPDCLSIIGMAREAAATFDLPLNYPSEIIENTHGNVHDYVKIKIENPELCPRYAGRVVTDVKIGPSPLWMQLKLIKAGMRPTNNIVDITNYVLLEYGQPIHAFDLDTLKHKEIVIRAAKEGEKITTLDDQERELEAGMLLITDQNEPIALAGVMGGANTEVSSTTQNILIEVANFDKKSIRKTSRTLQLRSEASSRYEKGVSQNLVLSAMSRVCHLIEATGAGKIVEGVIDVEPVKRTIEAVEVRTKRINGLLGLNLTAEQMANYLRRLEIEVEIKEDVLVCTPPHQRLDLLKEVDFAEEIARLYGYDVIPSTLFRGNEWGALTNGQTMIKETRELLVACGLNEVTTYSFVSPKTHEQINLSEHSILRNAVQLMNPLGEEYSIMRTTLLPNLLEVLARNYKRSVKAAQAFEVGNVFFPKQQPIVELPIEKKMLVLGMYGENQDFYTLKGVLEKLFETFGVRNYKYEPETTHATYHPGRCANVILGDNHVLATLGEVHPQVLSNYDVDVPIMVCELDMNMLMQITNTYKKFDGIPKYPASTRDLAVLVKDEITNQMVIDIIKAKGGKFLESAEIFDVYKGEQIEKGYKSMAYALSFRAPDRTLVDEDVNKAMEKILKQLEDELGAELR
ncbi:MAG: phenylalanine--tRNA ligase subunit beta [Clostridia bacterium]|nr:phenylalanine--tRNA ligase subunit beta [Clostridia bacterium]